MWQILKINRQKYINTVICFLFKVEILLNGQVVDELTQIAHVTKAREMGKRIVHKLKETLPQQLFEIVIQARVGNKIIGRETLRALRKDVLAKCVSTM